MSKDLSGFFKAVADDFKSITFYGHSFRVRRLTSKDNIRAARYAKEDSIAVLEGMPEETKNAPYDREQLAKWVEFKSSSNVGLAETFGMNSIVTQGDLERCMCAVASWNSYIYALTLVHDDGTDLSREDVGKIAAVIQQQPKLEKLIYDALLQYQADAEESSPNGQAQQVTQ